MSGAFYLGAQIWFPRFQSVRNETHDALQFLSEITCGFHLDAIVVPATVNSISSMRSFWNACRSRTPQVEEMFFAKTFMGSIIGASKLQVIRITSVNSISHIGLEILIGLKGL